MKVIMVMYDSLNRKMLSPYGCDWIQTPNFKRLAEKAVTFDTNYVASMPCMPARRELHTGRYNFLHRSWGPLEPYDDSMPQLLKQNGIYSHIISDHYHYWEDGGCTYHNKYSTWEIVRGQEGDPWKGVVQDPVEPEHLGVYSRQDAINRTYMDSEDKMPQTQVFNLGLEFMDKNRHADNWFLQIETFDPHEPFYSMQAYKDKYPHEYKGPHFDWPPYRKVTESLEEVAHVRNEYAALMSMCDDNLGKVLDKMDQYNMWEDTMLIVNTDHGFLLGEHGVWAKCVHPMYEEVAHSPLFVWDPRAKVKGEHRKALVQTIDLAPTVLDYFGLEQPKDMLGKALAPVIKGDIPVRETGIFGFHGGQLCITDGRYVYMRATDSDWKGEVYNYTHMPTHMRTPFTFEELRQMTLRESFEFTKGCPVMKVPSGQFDPDPTNKDLLKNMLFDLQQDPTQEQMIKDEAVEAYMLEQIKKHLKENDAPIELYERLGLQ